MADENDQLCNYWKLSSKKLHQLLHRFVHITLFEGEELYGWIYTIDPVSYTIALAKDMDVSEQEKLDFLDSRMIVFVMRKAVRELRILETTRKEPEWLKSFTVKERQHYTDEELQKRKMSLIDWLNKNRVPVIDDDSVESEVVKILGGLVIEPPYNVDSCKGTNEIVLDRIRKLISSMPVACIK